MTEIIFVFVAFCLALWLAVRWTTSPLTGFNPNEADASGVLSASAGTYSATMALVVSALKMVIAGVSGTSATCTLNCAQKAPAGKLLIIETTADGSGTVTVTFGTNFRSTGTQASTLSTVSEVLFIGDGTKWNEVCRTTATAQ